MSPSQASKWLHGIARRMPSALDRGIKEWASWSRGIALTFSSGRVRQAAFDAPFGATTTTSGRKLTQYRHGSAIGLGHPYGYGTTGSLGPRGPIPYGDPSKVNTQSGDFFRHWHLAPLLTSASNRNSLDAHSWFLLNDSEHARALVDGTTKMIRRPILDRIVNAAEGRARYFGVKALHDLFN